jgi:hypothetical protein
MKIILKHDISDVTWFIANVFIKWNNSTEVSKSTRKLYENITLLVCADSKEEAERKTVEYCKSQEISYISITNETVSQTFEQIWEIEEGEDWILDGRVIELYTNFYSASAYEKIGDVFDEES